MKEMTHLTQVPATVEHKQPPPHTTAQEDNGSEAVNWLYPRIRRPTPSPSFRSREAAPLCPVFFSRGTHDDGELELEDGEEAEGDGGSQVRVRLVAHIPTYTNDALAQQDNRERTSEANALPGASYPVTVHGTRIIGLTNRWIIDRFTKTYLYMKYVAGLPMKPPMSSPNATEKPTNVQMTVTNACTATSGRTASPRQYVRRFCGADISCPLFQSCKSGGKGVAGGTTYHGRDGLEHGVQDGSLVHHATL